MRFRTESRDGPPGQTNLRLIAEVDGSAVGCLDYVLYRGKPSINMIEVPQNFRRNGYGSAMVYQLQQEFPNQEIDWGMLTDDGAKLFASLPKRFVPSPEYAAKSKLFAANKVKLAEYSRLAEVFHGIERPTDAERAAFESATRDWNALHDMQWELERYFESTPPGVTLLVHPDCAERETMTPRPRMRA